MSAQGKDGRTQQSRFQKETETKPNRRW
jgi:hypothetical protein